jgi:hypothetical protein
MHLVSETIVSYTRRMWPSRNADIERVAVVVVAVPPGAAPVLGLLSWRRRTPAAGLR